MYEHTPVCAATFARGPEQPTVGTGHAQAAQYPEPQPLYRRSLRSALLGASRSLRRASIHSLVSRDHRRQLPRGERNIGTWFVFPPRRPLRWQWISARVSRARKAPPRAANRRWLQRQAGLRTKAVQRRDVPGRTHGPVAAGQPRRLCRRAGRRAVGFPSRADGYRPPRPLRKRRFALGADSALDGVALCLGARREPAPAPTTAPAHCWAAARDF